MSRWLQTMAQDLRDRTTAHLSWREFSSVGAALAGVLCVLLILVVAARLPILSSLWLDETISAWVSREGYAETVRRSLGFQGQSPLYFLILFSLRKVCGASEICLRAPSLVFAVLALILLFYLARRVLGAFPALLAALLLVLMDGFQVAAISARPYSLALALSLGSSLALVRWLAHKSKRAMLVYVILLTLLFYAHYLFVLIAPVHLLWCLLAPREQRPRLRDLILAYTLAVLLCLPGVMMQLLFLFDTRSSLLFLSPPSWRDFVSAVLPMYVAVYIVVAVLVARINYRFTLFLPTPSGSLGVAALLGWWLIVPTLLFLAGRTLNEGLFVSRWLLWVLPGAAMLGAVLLGGIVPARARVLAVCVILLLALYREGSKEWHLEGWREASQMIRAEDDAYPVLLFSGLAENEDLNLLLSQQRRAYGGTPFHHYPVPGRIAPIPGDLSPPKADYIRALLRHEEQFYLAALEVWRREDAERRNLRAELETFLQELGYIPKQVGQSGKVKVVRYTQRK